MKNSLLLRCVVIAVAAAAALCVTQTASATGLTVTAIATPVDIYSGTTTLEVVSVENPNDFGVEIESITGDVEYNGTYSADIPGTNYSVISGHGNPGDVIDSAAFDTAPVGACTVGEVLTRSGTSHDSCDVYLTLTASVTAPTVAHPATYSVNPVVIGVVAGYTEDDGDPTVSGYGSFRVDVVDTPEPGSLVLLGTGMLGLAGVLRRKLCKG